MFKLRKENLPYAFIQLLTLLLAMQVSGLMAQESAQSASREPAASKSGLYDPLKVDSQATFETLLLDVEYRPDTRQRPSSTASEARKVPIKVYLPGGEGKCPVVLFSHGLGGSREGFKHGGEHWARRGYVAIFLQHPGSDESVWRDRKLGQRAGALREAASADNLLLRIADVKAVIDYLHTIDREGTQLAQAAQQLRSRLDLKHLGMSGHSFGAITTQMVSGQSPALASQQPRDQRITAAIVLSPSTPKLGQPAKNFGQVSIPWLLMTGTKDDSPIGEQTAETRLKVFPALPAGNKYQVVFDGGTHGFLGERQTMFNQPGDQSSHAQATLALSTAFWDAYLKQDENARRWLDGDGPKSILAARDQWQKK